jgi:hypothetical protein
MKGANVFATNMASTFQLNTMILPQLEQGIHGVPVVGMMFFDDNLCVLRSGDPFGARLTKVVKAQIIMLVACDQCAVRRGFAEGAFHQCGTGEVKPECLFEGAQVGCFSQMYVALGRVDGVHVITL